MEVHRNTLSRRVWERFANACDAGLQQRWTYGEVVQSLGGQVERFVVGPEASPCLLAQVIVRDFGVTVGLISRGPLVLQPSNEAMTDLRQALRRAGVRVLICTPPASCAIAGVKLVTPATQARLSLADGLEERMHQKWRNRLRVAQKAGAVRTIGAHPSKYEWLLSENRRAQKARGVRDLPASFTRAWGSVAPDQVMTLSTGSKRAPEAGMMFLTHGTTATYHIGWSNDAGRKANAHNLLLWSAAERLAAEGVGSIDLGRLDTVNAPGLARFKLGAGAQPERLGNTWISF